MQTSLRYGGDTKSLRIHAKEKFPFHDPKFLLQVHGELDTSVGPPTFFAVMIRNFYPQLSASTGIGIQYDNLQKNLKYCLRGKKSFPISSSGLFSFDIKGRYDVDNKYTEQNGKGAAELTWSILNFQEDQDIQLKLGYEVSNNSCYAGSNKIHKVLQIPYLKIRERNWTLKADINGRWNIRYDL